MSVFDDIMKEQQAKELAEAAPENAENAEALKEEAVAEPFNAEAVKDDLNIDDSVFTEEERKAISAYAQTIDVRDTTTIMQYGSGLQKKMADFSGETLNTAKAKDLGEVGDLLVSVVGEVKGFDAETDKKGFLGLFKKSQVKINELKSRYDKAETNITKITNALEDHQVTLLKDVATLDKMYDLNLESYKEMTMYILAGKQRLEEIRSTELADLMKKAEETGRAEDAQAARDLADQCDRFEKKLYDLNLSRTIAMQTAPQIRMLQSTDTQLAEKIQSVIVNTIPLWKNQMVISLGIAHSQEAMAAENAVTNATNELLKKNAETLHMASVEAAKANERGIVDIETLKHTNQELMNTLEEVLKIQQEGRAARQNAEVELQKMEEELKDKLLEMSKQ